MKDRGRIGVNNASSWHLKGDIKQTIQVPIKASSNLTRNIKDKIKDVAGPDKVHTMTVEMDGRPITAGIMSKDPFRQHQCRFGNQICMVDTKQDCKEQNTVYMISCKEPECIDREDRKHIFWSDREESSVFMPG